MKAQLIEEIMEEIKTLGDWGHEAWIESIPETVHRGIIREIRDDGWHISIRTDGGYNDIELRCEFGYEAGLCDMRR